MQAQSKLSEIPRRLEVRWERLWGSDLGTVQVGQGFGSVGADGVILVSGSTRGAETQGILLSC